MIFDFSGDFLNVDSISSGDIAVIIEKPYAEEKESTQLKEMVDGVMKNKKYVVMNIPLEINGKRKIWTVGDKGSGIRLQKAYGMDSDLWVGKKIRFLIEAYKAYGIDKKRAAAYPLTEEKA